LLESISNPFAEMVQRLGQDIFKSNAELFQQLGASLAQASGISNGLADVVSRITVLESEASKGEKSADESNQLSLATGAQPPHEG
jgi:hypothetical protein